HIYDFFLFLLFFFTVPAHSLLYTLSLHDALPIYSWYGLWGPARLPRDIVVKLESAAIRAVHSAEVSERMLGLGFEPTGRPAYERSEEHTSELQSQSNLVCRLLLEKKKQHIQELQ